MERFIERFVESLSDEDLDRLSGVLKAIVRAAGVFMVLLFVAYVGVCFWALTYFFIGREAALHALAVGEALGLFACALYQWRYGNLFYILEEVIQERNEDDE